MRKKILEWAKEVLTIEAEGLLHVRDKVSTDFSRSVELIFSCEGRVVTSGIGKSGIIARKIAATLSSTGTPSFFLHPTEALHGDLGMVRSRDVLLAMSYSGETEELCHLAKIVRHTGIKIITFTGNTSSRLALLSDVVVNVAVPREACSLGAPTTSTTASLAMGDALAVVLTRMKKFSLKDFQLYHPGGYIGERLSVPISEIMRQGEEIPMVPLDAPVDLAIKEMSEKGLGATLIMKDVKDYKSLKGIFTDGDLRRSVSRWGSDLYNKRMETIMTPNPRYININGFVSDALEMMERYLITVLPVIDEEQTVRGIIHLHDLLGKGRIHFKLYED